jgi:hypothetical protein
MSVKRTAGSSVVALPVHHFLARHSTQITRSPESRLFILSKNDPYKCVSHSALLHDGHTPPFPALKNTLHLSHCQVNADCRKIGTYTIARVWEPLHDAPGLSSTGDPICAASTQTILM